VRDKDREWIEHWLEQVASGALAMSQRALTAIEARGGIDALVDAAKHRGVHLVELTDDRGKRLIAASKHPFRTLC